MLLTCTPRLSSQVHLRPLERTGRGAARRQMRDRRGLPQTHGEPRRGQPPEHREDAADLPAALQIPRTQ